MKNYFLFFLLMFQAWAAFAQKDTVRYMDPWYRFNPLSSRTSAYPPTSDYGRTLIGTDCLQIYSNIYEKVPVYGIAIVADTDIIKGTRRPDSTRFQAILYDSVSEWNDTLYGRVYSYIGVEGLDTAFFDSYTRLCYFEYHYNYEQEPLPIPFSIYNPGALVSPCFELYFDKPYESYWDNICVGRHYDPFIEDGSSLWVLITNYIKDSTSSSYYFAHNGPGSFLLPAPDWRSADVYHYNWGGMFPIVNLRCTMPRRVRETGRGGG